MGQLSLAAIHNRLKRPYLLSGNNLYTANWNAEMNAGNADGKGAAKKMGAFPIYFDPFNVEAMTPKSTFMIDPNAVAFVNKARYSTDPDEFVNGADKTLFAIKSNAIPGVMYDVVYDTVCSGNDIVHRYKIHATGKFILNPTGCDTDITGVLEFTCGNPES
jgi:hypothetical protein